MPDINELDRVQATIEQKLRASAEDKLVIGTVGFTANYSIYVHEDLEANHPNGGQAKFLEEPARTLPLAQIIVTAYKAGASLYRSITIACLRLQREAQLLTPVDTGNLKGSAFTEVTKE